MMVKIKRRYPVWATLGFLIGFFGFFDGPYEFSSTPQKVTVGFLLGVVMFFTVSAVNIFCREAIKRREFRMLPGINMVNLLLGCAYARAIIALQGYAAVGVVLGVMCYVLFGGPLFRLMEREMPRFYRVYVRVFF